MKMMDWKIVVASPSRSIRAALQNILGVRLGINSVTEAESAADALKKLHCHRQDIIIYDTDMDDLPLTHFISESGVAKSGSQALILVSSPDRARTVSSSHGNTPIRRLIRPFTADELMSLFRDIYDPMEYRRAIRVHPPDGVSLLIKCGSSVAEGEINDISMGGLSCSTAVADGLSIYSTAALTLLWDDMEPGDHRVERYCVEAEAIRLEALPSPGSDDKRCLVAFRFIERQGDGRDFLTEKINRLIDATSREIG